MLDLNDYFNPVEIYNTSRNYIHPSAQLSSLVSVHTKKSPIKDFSEFNLALVSLPTSNSNYEFLDEYSGIREELYSLCANKKTRLCDLGNFKTGKTKNDTIIGLRDVIIHLIECNVLPILIGNSEDLLYAQYLANKKSGNRINIVSIDSKIAANENKEINDPTALWKILISENEALSIYTNIGFQSYFVNPRTLQFISENYHNALRIGYIRSDIKEAEPILRDAALIGLNIASIRQSDAPAQNHPSPNGFYGEEICQIARYSGTSNSLSSFGIYDFNPLFDSNKQTSRLIAQLIWYFIEGYYQRINEHPLSRGSQYKKFIVSLDKNEQELIFYKSEKTDRWWMEIPIVNDTSKPILASCTYEDYLKATSGELPDRWLTMFRKNNPA